MARSRAERLISEGAQLLVGAFDSGPEHGDRPGGRAEGHPLRHQHRRRPADHRAGLQVRVPQLPDRADDPAATPSPTRRSSSRPRARRRSRWCSCTSTTLSARDAEGHRRASCPKFEMPYKIAETIAYDPAARDLSVEVAKAKATGAEALLLVSRLNDAILLTRELVKQRWTPTARPEHGSGLVRGPVPQDARQARATGRMSFVPWYDPNKQMSKQLEAALAKAHPDINLNTNHIYTFEALLIAADAYKRAGSDRSQGAGRGASARPTSRQRQHRPRHPVRRQGPERGAEERRRSRTAAASSSPWRRRPRAERQARIADEGLRQARLTQLEPSAPAARRPELARADAGACRNLSQRRRQRPADRPRLRPDGARPVGHLRRRARRQFRPRRDDDDRHVPGARAVRRARARSAVMLVPIAAVLFALGYVLQARPHQSVHQPARAQPVHAAGGGRDHPGQRAAHHLRSRRAGRADLLLLRQLRCRAA